MLDCYLPREDVRDAFVSPSARAAGGPAAGRGGGLLSPCAAGRSLRCGGPTCSWSNSAATCRPGCASWTRAWRTATFLAMAGLNRLGMADVARSAIEVDEMLPAVAQGAIGIERRLADDRVAGLLAAIHDARPACGLRRSGRSCARWTAPAKPRSRGWRFWTVRPVAAGRNPAARWQRGDPRRGARRGQRCRWLGRGPCTAAACRGSRRLLCLEVGPVCHICVTRLSLSLYLTDMSDLP